MHLISFVYVLSVGFHTVTTKLSNCNTNRMACKTKNIYHRYQDLILVSEGSSSVSQSILRKKKFLGRLSVSVVEHLPWFRA